jgi:hypothetical protein
MVVKVETPPTEAQAEQPLQVPLAATRVISLVPVAPEQVQLMESLAAVEAARERMRAALMVPASYLKVKSSKL